MTDSRGNTHPVAGWKIGAGSVPPPMDPTLLWSFIEDLIDKREGGILVLTHHNADIDAAATALVIKKAFPWVELGAHKSVSHGAKNLLDNFGEEMIVDPATEKYSMIYVVDSSSPLQVAYDGDLSKWPPYKVIDHHEDHGHWRGERYVDSSASSCVQIAVQMALMSGCPLDDDIAVCAVSGVISDTGKFRFAKDVDLAFVSALLYSTNVSMEEILGIIEGDNYFDISKKIAQLKALRRVKYTKVKDQVVASSTVSSFEASSARVLLVAGADVVFVGARKGNNIRISSRAKPHILNMGIHLGKFMEEIGQETGNQGGGHDGAAGLNGKGGLNEVLALCARRMSNLIRDLVNNED